MTYPENMADRKEQTGPRLHADRFLQDVPFSQVRQFMEPGRCFGILTAFRDDLPFEENLARNRELKRLVHRDFRFFLIDGFWITGQAGPGADVRDRLLFIDGADEEEHLLASLKHWLRRL